MTPVLNEIFSTFAAVDEAQFHFALAAFVLACGSFSFVTLLFFVNAPYGRYSSKTWGPLVPARLAWVWMESPCIWASAVCAYLAHAVGSPALASTPNRILLALFCAHYVNRAFVYPLRMRSSNPMPASIMLFAWLFCATNGYLQARALTLFTVYEEAWVWDPRFLVGCAVWTLGFGLNLQADDILRNLRKPGDKERYKIPRGGLFELVSGANFAAEILEWAGFALACWSFTALTFAVFTFLNTAPRGMAHHKWYQEKFDNYPKKRKGVIPFLW